MLWFVKGLPPLRCGLLAAMALMGMALKAQTPVVRSLSAPVHSISPEIVRAVTEKLPKYAPPSPTKAPAASVPDEVNDSPDILRLPKVTVKAAPPAQLSNYEVLTPKGRLDLALQLHPGLRVGNIFGMNNGIALAMLAEERDVQKKAALTETVERNAGNDPESKRMARLLKAATQRPSSDWLTNTGH